MKKSLLKISILALAAFAISADVEGGQLTSLLKPAVSKSSTPPICDNFPFCKER